MIIVVDSNIPYLDGVLDPYFEVRRLPSRDITAAAVRDADALLVRTRTRCDASLLDGSRVRFIGTATIGYDHIDLDYCHRHGIVVSSAPGCNAPAVAQYVLSAVGRWMAVRGIADPCGITMGVIGVGHVGSIVAQWAEAMGFGVLRNDPPRAEREGADGFAMLDEVLDKAHIITLHPTLTTEGAHPTYHLVDAEFLAQARRCMLLVNAARGAVCSTEALLQWHGDCIIDCWENEPNINELLLRRAFIATPHIAGYSIEGKQRATAMVLGALNRYFGIDVPVPLVIAPDQGVEAPTMESVMTGFNPIPLTQKLKRTPDQFEAMRNNYPLRHSL